MTNISISCIETDMTNLDDAFIWKIDCCVLDGDTPIVERERICQCSDILLTNPDMIHFSLLPQVEVLIVIPSHVQC